jgi:DDE family transposase
VTTSGSPIPPRWNAAGPARPPGSSDLAGWAEYGYRASHSRWFWGLRLHLLCTLHGLPGGFALTGAKAGERQVLLDILADPALAAGRAGQLIIADKNYYGRDFEAALA